MRRRKVDWEEELRKTERIQKRGLFTSAMSFVLAIAVVYGVGRFGGVKLAIPSKVIGIFCFVTAAFLFRAIVKRRERLKREKEERGE